VDIDKDSVGRTHSIFDYLTGGNK